jgi:hypothetical protein
MAQGVTFIHFSSFIQSSLLNILLPFFPWEVQPHNQRAPLFSSLLVYPFHKGRAYIFFYPFEFFFFICKRPFLLNIPLFVIVCRYCRYDTTFAFKERKERKLKHYTHMPPRGKERGVLDLEGWGSGFRNEPSICRYDSGIKKEEEEEE